MPRKTSLAILLWLAVAAVAVLSYVSQMPDCDVDRSAELCDSLAALGFASGYITGGVAWAVVMVVLAIAWLVPWIRADRTRRPGSGV